MGQGDASAVPHRMAIGPTSRSPTTIGAYGSILIMGVVCENYSAPNGSKKVFWGCFLHLLDGYGPCEIYRRAV